MKKIICMLLLGCILGITASPVLASGGKHHGDKGKGKVVRNQVAK